MNHDVITLIDIVGVIIIPIVIFVVGASLPRWFEKEKTRRFLALIKRELREMEPWPKEPKADGNWYEHLKKKFVHEEIFRSVSENRDFILSLPPDVTYNAAQLWTHYRKATCSQVPEELAEHGASWCDYLRGLCLFFDQTKKGNFIETIYVPWEYLVTRYHPELRKSGRLLPRKL